MKQIDELEKQIKDEEASLKSRIEKLQNSMLKDEKVLKTFAERFARAVQDEAGDKELAQIEAQRNEASKRVEQNEEIIRILTSSNGSKLQRLKTEFISENLKQLKSVEDAATEVFRGLSPHEDAIMEGFEKLNELREIIINHKKTINSHSAHLSDDDKMALGIPEEGLYTYERIVGARNPLEQQMVDMIQNISMIALSQFEHQKLAHFFLTRGIKR